ncbi:MAG: hypothetical protein U9O59_01935 [Actinomycetota bacterium]|nr:hypothetical protein [Actinomycetota bacterium]
MKGKKAFLNLRLFLTVFFLFLAMSVIVSGCACPLFSLLGKFTGVQMKAGKNIDESIIEGELIYPGSAALLQAEGDIEAILEIVSNYGAVVSEEELEVLEKLPGEIREQEISATFYSTADSKEEVLDYYNSFKSGNWEIIQMQGEQQVSDENKPAMLVASDDEKTQAFALVGTENNTFIIFLGFDFEALSGLEEK